MAEYKAIHGTLFQHKTSDPLGAGAPGGAWASGGNLNTARHSSANGTTGIQTAAIASAGNPNRAIAEQYNGSSWTEVADLNTGRHNAASCATSYTALIVAGGRKL